MTLPIVSIILAISASYMAFRWKDEVLHPAFWTNVGFVGYSISGLYFSAFGVEKARFLNLAGVTSDVYSLLSWSAIIVLTSFVMSNAGFYLGDKITKGREFVKPRFNSGLSDEVIILGRAGSLVLIFCGLIYYIHFADRVAGGIGQLFSQVAAYNYLTAAAGMSALPLHLIYGGAFLWLLTWAASARRQWVGLIFVPLSALVMLSTGRITLANVYAFSSILTFLLLYRGRVGWRAFGVGFAVLAPINITFFFWRQYSSYVFAGKKDEFVLTKPIPDHVPPMPDQVSHVPETILQAPSSFDVLFMRMEGSIASLMTKMKYVIDWLVGGGNTPDLQQIALITKGIEDGDINLKYGETFGYWLQNLLSSRIGQDLGEPSSVGHVIKSVYFPDTVGAPVPGIIGEAIINFGYVGPLFLVALCAAAVMLYRAAISSGSAFVVLSYCLFLVGVWALLCKVDSSSLLGLLRMILPYTAAWGAVVLADKIWSVAGAKRVT